MKIMKNPLVGIIMGSSSDSRIMHSAAEILDEFGVPHEDQIISAHRTPTRLEEYAKHAEKNGFKVIIAGAGGAAHLPGMIASHTVLPVIGVPILVYNDKQQKKSAFGGLDSLLSISEMPSGSPVVTVGVNKALNAGIYALKILANESSSIRKMLKSHKEKQHKSVLKESQDLKKMGLKKFVKKKFKIPLVIIFPIFYNYILAGINIFNIPILFFYIALNIYQVSFKIPCFSFQVFF